MKQNYLKSITLCMLSIFLMVTVCFPSTVVKAEGLLYWEHDEQQKYSYCKEKDGLVYFISDGEACVSEILYEASEVRIPETVYGCPVTKISVVYIPHSVKTLYLPKTLESFYIRSLYRNLKNIIVDKANPYYCSKDGVLYNKNMTTLVRVPFARTKITIPKSVKKIKTDAFLCTNIKNIVIPDTVKSMGDNAFAECWKLESVKLSKNLKEISAGAFKGCNSLKTITIPKNVRTISASAFLSCSKLNQVTFEKGSKLKEIGELGFASCDSLRKISLPKGVQKIELKAFDGCCNLEQITLPDSLTRIDYMVFRECRKLKSITIPQNVKKIDNYAFARCKSLRKIRVEGTALKAIETSAFKGVSKNKITITAKKNSYAYRYAKKNGFKYKAL